MQPTSLQIKQPGVLINTSQPAVTMPTTAPKVLTVNDKYAQRLGAQQTANPEEVIRSACTDIASSALQIAAALKSETTSISETAIESGAEKFIERMAAADSVPRFKNDEIIDKFLTQTDLRIRVDENGCEAEDVATGPCFDPEDDYVSEDLAKIYAAQGLNMHAIEIYRKLCLLNSEKSAYFARLIDELKTKY